MKKLLSILLAVAMSAFCFIPSVFAAQDAVKDKARIYFDDDKKTLTLNVNLAHKGETVVGVMIAPDGLESYSPETIEANSDVIFKVYKTDSTGVAVFDIDMSANTFGRYFLQLSTDTLTVKRNFVSAGESDLFNEYAVKKNYFATVPSVVNPRTTSADAAVIAKYIAANAADVKDNKSAVETYVRGEAVAYVMNNKLALEDAFELYEQYFDESCIEKFASLTADVKAKASALFANNGCDDVFANVFEANIFVAKYACSSNESEIKNLVLGEMSKGNEQLTARYNSLIQKYSAINNDFYMGKVFENMFLSRASAANINDVLTAFENQINIQAAAASDSGSGSGSGSSGRGTSGKGVSGTMPSTPTSQPSDGKFFSDVSDTWAKASIEKMTAKGIINGYSDGTFKPEQSVTRAEMAKMIAVLLGLSADGKSIFEDVADGEWFSGYVTAVAQSGIVKGSGGRFMPSEYITRQDTAVMIARALEFNGKTVAADTPRFADNNLIADYATPYVGVLANMGVVNGSDGKFMPLSNITRAETAALLDRISDIIE